MYENITGKFNLKLFQNQFVQIIAPIQEISDFLQGKCNTKGRMQPQCSKHSVSIKNTENRINFHPSLRLLLSNTSFYIHRPN